MMKRLEDRVCTHDSLSRAYPVSVCIVLLDFTSIYKTSFDNGP